MTWDEYRHNFDGVPVLLIKKIVKVFGCAVQIHKFVKADAAGCFHSHPAWAVRLVLWGGYVEETGDGRWQTWFPGRIGIVAPDFEHRIGGLRNGRSSWSLWLRGPKIASITVRGCDAPAHSLDVAVSARSIIAIRDALVGEDLEEAYHQLYKAVDPEFVKLRPWAEIEAATAMEGSADA